jgi:hypothetical protein
MLRLEGRKTLMKEKQVEVQNAPTLPINVAIGGKSPQAASRHVLRYYPLMLKIFK